MYEMYEKSTLRAMLQALKDGDPDKFLARARDLNNWLVTLDHLMPDGVLGDVCAEFVTNPIPTEDTRTTHVAGAGIEIPSVPGPPNRGEPAPIVTKARWDGVNWPFKPADKPPGTLPHR